MAEADMAEADMAEADMAEADMAEADMAEKAQISPGTKVHLRFVLRLDGGEEIDRTPIEGARFTVGDGSLLPGFERALFGMTAGTRQTLPIAPRDGFGEGSEDNVQRFLRSRFGADEDLSVGLMYSFADGPRGELPGLVIAVTEEFVTVDFNHPLAGKEILFEVDILAVERVSDKIIKVG